MSERMDHEDCPKPQTCPALGSQSATVFLPVAISPFAIAGHPKIKCCGEPEIVTDFSHCPGKKNGTCEFMISQKIRVDIPVEFGAAIDIGDTYVDCDCAIGESLDLRHGCECHEDKV